MLVRLLLFISISGFLGFAEASVCAEEVGSCSYYTCKSKALSCSPTDYPIKMGKHYCDKFSAYEKSMSTQGKKFVTNLRSCLQLEMEKLGDSLNCNNSYTFSKEHHVRCYLENGFCHLNVWDKLIILRVTFDAITKDELMKSTTDEINAYCKTVNPIYPLDENLENE